MIDYLAYHATREISKHLEAAGANEKVALNRLIDDVETWRVLGEEDLIIQIIKQWSEE